MLTSLKTNNSFHPEPHFDLHKTGHSVLNCQACPRLRSYCTEIAKIKRKSYANQTYWGKPITGFGDPQARVVIVGLAPAAHGANRTGRIFTGDRSGDWLYRALHKAGFANQPTSTHRNDGLVLNDVYITCVVKCAPPDNKPSREEEDQCSSFLEAEIEYFRNARVWIALGQIAYRRLWKLFNSESSVSSVFRPQVRHEFRHGAEISLSGNRQLLLSYHPSQQNTFTKRLTEPMFDSIFTRTRKLLG